MTTLSVILGDGRPGPDLKAIFRPLLQALNPGDEVICPLLASGAGDLHGLRQDAGTRRLAVFGTDNPHGTPPPGAVALRPVLTGGFPPPGGIVGFCLARAQGDAILWLPGPVVPDFSALPRLRSALAKGSDLAIARDGLLLLRRDLARRAVLPLPEAPPGLERAAWYWRARLVTRFPHGPLAETGCTAIFGPPPAQEPPEAAFALFDTLDRLIVDAGGGAEARREGLVWLLGGVARDLEALPEWRLWTYATAARAVADRLHPDPLPDQQAETARRALAMLADKPLWEAVLDWQAMRLAGQAPGAAQDKAIAQARALWRGMRAAP